MQESSCKSRCHHVPSDTGTDLFHCVQNENSEQTTQIKFYLWKFIKNITCIYTFCTFEASLNVKYGTINLQDHISSKCHPAVFIPDAEIRDTLLDNSFPIFFGKKENKSL